MPYQANTTISAIIASAPLPPAVQIDIATTGGDTAARELATNPHLTRAAWTALYRDRKVDVDRAVRLVERTLDHGQLDHVLVTVKDRRSAVLSQLLRHNRPTAEQLTALAAGRVPSRIADDLIVADWADDAAKEHLLRHASPVRALAWIARRDVDTPFETVAAVAERLADTMSLLTLGALLQRYPRLVDRLTAGTPDAVWVVPLLTSGRVPHDDQARVADELDGSYVANRSVPASHPSVCDRCVHRSGGHAARPPLDRWDAADLDTVIDAADARSGSLEQRVQWMTWMQAGAHPGLTDDQQRRLGERMADPYVRDQLTASGYGPFLRAFSSPAALPGASVTVAELRHHTRRHDVGEYLAGRLGGDPRRWQVALALLADAEPTMTLADVCDAAVALTAQPA